jgi:hypothetical protein
MPSGCSTTVSYSLPTADGLSEYAIRIHNKCCSQLVVCCVDRLNLQPKTDLPYPIKTPYLKRKLVHLTDRLFYQH